MSACGCRSGVSRLTGTVRTQQGDRTDSAERIERAPTAFPGSPSFDCRTETLSADFKYYLRFRFRGNGTSIPFDAWSDVVPFPKIGSDSSRSPIEVHQFFPNRLVANRSTVVPMRARAANWLESASNPAPLRNTARTISM